MSATQVPLEEAFWFQEGPGVRNWQFKSSGVKLLNVANIVKDGSIDLSKTDRHLSKSEVEGKYSHFLVDSGDLVIASSGITIDEDGYLRTRGAFIEDRHLPLCMNTSTIRFKSLKGISELPFFRHWLQSFEFRSQITREVTGIAQKNFGPSHLRRVRITLPPLDEQKRIAAMLDAADALRAKRRESIALLDDLLQSTFLDMFGDPVTNPNEWKRVPLEAVCEKVIDCPHSTPRWRESGVVCLRTSNLGKGEWVWTDTRFVTEEEFNERTKRSEILLNDIVLSREGTVGVLAIVQAGMRVCMGQRLVQIRVDETKLLPQFLLYVLLHALAPERLSRLMAGSTSKHLNVKELRRLPVARPPLELQLAFTEVVESVNRQKARLRLHRDELDALFLSLQSRAFDGKLWKVNG